MFLDLSLAILHHLLIFLLAAMLAAEFVLLRPGLAGRDLHRLGQVDAAYGGLALAVIVVGVLRVFFGLRGWDFYAASPAFWLKMGAFLLTGLLSIPPTLRIASWRREAANTSGVHVVPEAELRRARRFVGYGAVAFAFIPVFAAMMARGY